MGAARADGTLSETLIQDAAARRRAQELSSTDEIPPAAVPGYEIVRRVGAGKFGSVWLAREQNTGKLVAIKFYLRRRSVDWSLLSREVEKLAVLYTSHHIVRLLAVGWDHDPPYFVMEYLENGSLAQRLERGPLSIADAVRIATRVAQALVHAHGSGILHCDLKPANVLLDQDWEPRLCDFGQSRLADEHQHALGTLFYMAPEQSDLKAVPDARWDVYALGALLYQMLCGDPPFRTVESEARLRDAPNMEARVALYRELVRTEPRPTAHRRVGGVDPALAEIVDRCLALDPQRRFPNAQAVLDRLGERARQRARRPLIFMGLVLPLLLVLALLPFALDALRDAVTTSRSNLIQRALESDVLSVNLLSHTLERELQHRLDELVTLAQDEDVRAAIEEHQLKPAAERGPLRTVLNERIARIERRRDAAGRVVDASWFLQDAQGIQRWRHPDSVSVDRSFACRDYFHGRGVDYFEKDCPAELPPITKPHVSVAYRSTSSDRYVVALSVPVLSHAVAGDRPPQVIGVLARTMFLSELLRDYEQSLQAQGAAAGRKLALIDSRSWSLLAHQWMDEGHLQGVANPLQSLRLAPRIITALETLSPGLAHTSPIDRLDDYQDPVGGLDPERYGVDWLAAFSPVGSTGWIAVVQEPRDPVLKPVEQLRTRLVWSGIGGILLVCGLVAGCWWIIIRLMNERHPGGWRWWRRGPALGTASLTGKVSESA
jgi:serine/threonine protein kinase